MLVRRLTMGASGVLWATLALAAAPPVALMPQVSEVEWGDSAAIRGQAVIVLSEKASPPERHAAQLLQRHIQRRFGQEWPISSGAKAGQDAGLRILLGQNKTFPALGEICSQRQLSVPEQADGYALAVWAKDGKVTAALAGSNDRGVIYGQDTLFQLFSQKGDAVEVRCATIRDWPTIPMRGRPHPHYEYFFKSENFDALLTSRLNFIDVRDGIYAFEPGAKIKRDEIAKVISDARERGLIVYAVVNCGVPASQYDAVIASFKEFLDLGCNALWLSYDDKGPGEAPREITARVLALGRERGITGDRIAITPPKGSYQVIDMKFNREIVAVPGMEQAVWYWTSVPCPDDVADAREIGLKVLPSWWHNWPRFQDPPFGAGEGRGYSPIISMAEGWNHPTDQELIEAGKHVHAVLPWDGWQHQQHYLLPAIGWWSWRPERYDFSAIRRRAYDMVFGPAHPEAAAAFDDMLRDLQRSYLFTVTHSDWAPQCPPRLRSQENRPAVLAELAELRAQLDRLQQSPSGSALDRELLERDYVGPMKREVASALAQAKAPFPEYWWIEHQGRLLEKIYDGDMAGADQLIAAARERVSGDLSELERLFEGVRVPRSYVEWWRKRSALSAADWKELVSRRQVALKERVTDYARNIARLDGLLAGVGDPPVQIGTKAWKRHNHVMATVTPEPREHFWGDWIGGLVEDKDVTAAVFAIDRGVPVREGGFSELPVRIPVSGRRDRLALVIYLADQNKESFGFGYARWRWFGSRSIRLLWKDQEVWRADLGIPRPTGEWFVTRLPSLPPDLKTLDLRLRVEDYESAKNNLEIVCVGPIRLLELDLD